MGDAVKRTDDVKAKQKTSINWLGGGSKYMTESLIAFETQYKMYEALVEMMSIEECAKNLKKDRIRKILI